MTDLLSPERLEMERENDRLRLALDGIGRLARLCWLDMQGRIVDDEHRRAHRVLASIAKSAADAVS